MRTFIFDRRLESQRKISSYRVLRFCSHMRMCMHKQKRQWACSSLKYDVRNGIYASFYVYDGSGAFLYDVHPTECDVNVRWYYTP